jgi:S1-C subfamily serine protease
MDPNTISRWFMVSIVLTLVSGAAHADTVETIAKVKPSVVIVGTYSATRSPRFALRGTGFVVGKGNWAITNAHVIPEGAEAELDTKLVVQVRTAPKGLTGQDDLNMRQATVVDVDKLHDLALLQFDGAPVPQLAIRNSDTVREGQSVAFMGFPIGGVLGYSAVTHRGMVSSVTPIALPTANAQQLNARTIASLRSGTFNIFQLDATAYPGNSGGPLFDPEGGELVGVINMVFIKRTKEAILSEPSGISYAIPSNFVLQILQRNGLN